MSDLFGNHIVGFPTRWLRWTEHKWETKGFHIPVERKDQRLGLDVIKLFFMLNSAETKINPAHEKTNNLHMRKQRRSNCEADQRLCFRYTDSTITLLSKSKISSF